MTWFPKPVLSFVFYEHWHRIDLEDLNVNLMLKHYLHYVLPGLYKVRRNFLMYLSSFLEGRTLSKSQPGAPVLVLLHHHLFLSYTLSKYNHAAFQNCIPVQD